MNPIWALTLFQALLSHREYAAGLVSVERRILELLREVRECRPQLFFQ